jgi:hypothetical protein
VARASTAPAAEAPAKRVKIDTPVLSPEQIKALRNGFGREMEANVAKAMANKGAFILFYFILYILYAYSLNSIAVSDNTSLQFCVGLRRKTAQMPLGRRSARMDGPRAPLCRQH